MLLFLDSVTLHFYYIEIAYLSFRFSTMLATLISLTSLRAKQKPLRCSSFINSRHLSKSVIPEANKLKQDGAVHGCESKQVEDKGFVDKPTPYELPKQQCILCKHKIQLDYKNPRLLSQFVSPLNGMVYDKHITGLCELQQTILQREIKKSRLTYLMPIYYRHPKYNADPKLFNPDRPQRPNPY